MSPRILSTSLIGLRLSQDHTHIYRWYLLQDLHLIVAVAPPDGDELHWFPVWGLLYSRDWSLPEVRSRILPALPVSLALLIISFRVMPLSSGAPGTCGFNWTSIREYETNCTATATPFCVGQTCQAYVSASSRRRPSLTILRRSDMPITTIGRCGFNTTTAYTFPEYEHKCSGKTPYCLGGKCQA